jgi:hypothetical protein
MSFAVRVRGECERAPCVENYHFSRKRQHNDIIAAAPSLVVCLSNCRQSAQPPFIKKNGSPVGSACLFQRRLQISNAHRGITFLCVAAPFHQRSLNLAIAKNRDKIKGKIIVNAASSGDTPWQPTRPPPPSTLLHWGELTILYHPTGLAYGNRQITSASSDKSSRFTTRSRRTQSPPWSVLPCRGKREPTISAPPTTLVSFTAAGSTQSWYPTMSSSQHACRDKREGTEK